MTYRKTYKVEHETDEYIGSVTFRYSDPLATMYHDGLQNAVLKNLGQYPGKTLEVGCGTGRMLKVLNQKKYDITGIDVSSRCILIAQKLCGRDDIAQVSSAEKLLFNNESFDTVFCLGVLHHLRDPNLSMNEIHRVLKPNGTFIAEEPNRNLFTLILRWTLKKISKSYREKPYQTDFTMKELRILLEKNNFSVELSERYGILSCFFSLPDFIPLNKIFGGSNRFSITIMQGLIKLDAFLCKLPVINHLCWQNIITCRKS